VIKNKSHTNHQSKHVALIALVFVAFFIQAFIPAGFMPDSKDGGTIVICSGDGFKTIPSPFDTTPHEREDNHTSSSFCPFQITAFGPGFGWIPSLTSVHSNIIILCDDLMDRTLFKSFTFPSFLARAPPSL